MGAGLIKNSDHLRIGQCGTILPDWHPLRVAEDIALLDNFTDGRVDFGVARGFDTRASAQFNATGDRRNPRLNSEFFNEALDVIIDAWKQEAPPSYIPDVHLQQVPRISRQARHLHYVPDRIPRQDQGDLEHLL